MPPSKTSSEVLHPVYTTDFQFLKWDLDIPSAAGEIAMHVSECVCVRERASE